jgi:hypothetical protein
MLYIEESQVRNTLNAMRKHNADYVIFNVTNGFPLGLVKDSNLIPMYTNSEELINNLVDSYNTTTFSLEEFCRYYTVNRTIPWSHQ